MIEREKIPDEVKADYQDKAGRADYCTRDTRPVPSLVEYQILLQWKARG
jgi:predicted type IV restriction endonuclease